jgi:hypothetical protein
MAIDESYELLVRLPIYIFGYYFVCGSSQGIRQRMLAIRSSCEEAVEAFMAYPVKIKHFKK